MECPAITDTKIVLGLQRPYQEDKDRTIAKFQLFGHKTEGMICRNWDDLQNAGNIGAKSYIKT